MSEYPDGLQPSGWHSQETVSVACASIKERLARIEEKQNQISRQLDDLIALFDRMVRVEERQISFNEEVREIKGDCEDLRKKLNAVENEFSSFKATKGILAWVAGIVSSVIAGTAVWFFRK